MTALDDCAGGARDAFGAALRGAAQGVPALRQ